MQWGRQWRRIAAAISVTAALAVAAPGAGAQEPSVLDCAGPAGDPAPGTLTWQLRELENVYCATQRPLDIASNPAYLQALAAQTRLAAMDPLREPLLWNRSRFRFQEGAIATGEGTVLPFFLFRPCDSSCAEQPAGLRRHHPPYPGVVIMHGGAANQEMYLWAAEGLAEAGYMVLTVNLDDRLSDGHDEAAKAGLDWLLSTPASPAVDGSHNPHWSELDRALIGLAGHSAGGVAVSRLGQEDRRVSAIVSWDRAQSGPMPDGMPLRAPGLFLTADFNCQQVPICLPEPRLTPPDPLGPGNKDEDFRRLRSAGVDTMKVALRAATHLDFTEWPPLNASRYGAVTSFYFTRAWFDRYLRGARDASVADEARRRLIAGRFDDSADVHNISSGRREPGGLANLPARIAGQPSRDRLSFHFRSGYWLDGGALSCEEMRAGCPTSATAPGMSGAPGVGAPVPKPRRSRCASLRRKLAKLRRARPATARKRAHLRRAKRKTRRQMRRLHCRPRR